MAKGDLEVNITATDRASDKLDEVAAKVKRVGDEEGEVVLKAEIKAAEADIRRLRKQLRDADGEEAEVQILADIDRAKSDLKAMKGQLDDLDSTVVEPEIRADDAAGAGSDAGGAFGAGAIKGVGAAGIAAAIAGVFNAGMDRIKARARIGAQFGLVKEDADRLSEQAGDIYADNWGESVGEVNRSLALIQQQLVDTGQVSESEMEKITISATAVADVLGIDVAEVVRSVSQLMVNGLAPDADAAFDLVTGAIQQGADKAGDFFDTIDEYSQHFGGMGLSGADMMTIITTGLQNGERDADKLADAVKEMRIRSVEDTDAITDAYIDLGLNADELRAAILEGGPAARQAFIEILGALRSVEDPVERQRLAVELIGTQYEDLGPNALESLASITDGTIDVAGATDQWVSSMEESVSQSETMWRRVTAVIGEVSEVFSTVVNKVIEFDIAVAGVADGLGLFDNVKNVWSFISGGADEAKIASEGLKGGLDDLAVAAAPAIRQMDSTGRAYADASIDAALLGEAVEETSEAVTDNAEEWDAWKSTMDDAAGAAVDAHTDMVDAANDWADGVRSAIDSGTASFYQLEVDGETTAQSFAMQMAVRNEAAANHESNLATVFSNIEDTLIDTGEVTGEQAGDFMGWLAEMGDAGAGLVSDMAENPAEVQAIFDEFVKSAELGSDGMVEGLDPTAKGVGEKMAAADVELQKQLNVALLKATINAQTIGGAIPDGIGAGISNGQGDLNAQIRSMMSSAVQAAKDEAQIKSPSQVFAEEVGRPISEGVAEGIDEAGDSISRSLTRQLEAGADAAVDAARDLVSQVRDELSGMWDVIGSNRNVEGMRDSVADATDGVADAEANLAGVMADSESSAEDVERARDQLESATERLEDANYRLATATFETSMADADLRKSWEQTALAAGLTREEIAKLTKQFDELTAAQDRAAGEEAAIAVTQAGVQSEIDAAAAKRAETMAYKERIARRRDRIEDDYDKAVDAGFVPDDAQGAIGDLSGQSAVQAKRDRLNSIEMFFGRDPKYSHVGSRFAAGETKIVVPGQVFTPDVSGVMSSVEESARMTSGDQRDGQRPSSGQQMQMPGPEYWAKAGEEMALGYARRMQRERRSM